MVRPLVLSDPYTIPTSWWHELDDGRIQCDVCPRACKLREGQRGTCFVRARQGDAIVLTSYGRSSGFCVDPIEKKPLNHFLPGSSVLSFGTAGCNLACRFCQNWDISKSKEIDTLAHAASPDAIAAAAVAEGCRSVAFTYNDPTVFLEYAVDTADACHDRGLRTVAVTAGYIEPGPRAELFSHIDAANVDLKGFTDDFYRHTCGADLHAVLDTLEYLTGTGVWLELTTLLIPGANDSDREIDAMTRWVVDHLGPDVPMHFTAFHPDYRMLETPATPYPTLRRARRIAIDNGVRFAYTGNVSDPDGQTTRCPRCGAAAIPRNGYTVSGDGIDDSGACRICGEMLPGVFDGPVGVWGPRRRRVEVRPSRPRVVRRPAVAGTFYPADRVALGAMLDRCLAEAVPPPRDVPVPKAVVVPHAGLVYSGPVAASAYARLADARGRIRRVVLIGPSHRVPVSGIALSGVDAFATPLGEVPVDVEGRAAAMGLPQVEVDDEAHRPEHCLEVQLPFLQRVLGDVEIVPMLTGACPSDVVARVLEALWGGEETLIVVSTDLSHYHPYDEAVRLDAATAARVLSGRYDGIADSDACGAHSLRGLLAVEDAARRGVELLDLRNSGDTSGARERVVGYGAFALT